MKGRNEMENCSSFSEREREREREPFPACVLALSLFARVSGLLPSSKSASKSVKVA